MLNLFKLSQTSALSQIRGQTVCKDFKMSGLQNIRLFGQSNPVKVGQTCFIGQFSLFFAAIFLFCHLGQAMYNHAACVMSVRG